MKSLIFLTLPLLFSGVVKSVDSSSIENENIIFEKENYFVLSKNIIIDDDSTGIVYKEISTYLESKENIGTFTFSYEDSTICKITYDEENIVANEKFEFNIFGLKEGSTTVSLVSNNEVLKSFEVYVLNSYINLDDIAESIVKPTSTSSNPYKFDLCLVEGADISGIEQYQVSFDLIENNNDCIKVLKSPEIIPPYGVKIQTTENSGTAVLDLKIKYTDINNNSYLLASKEITINVVTQDNYFDFYTYKNNEFIEISDENPAEVECFSKYSIYIGNLTKDFNIDDFEIKNEDKLGNFVHLELEVCDDESIEFPMLKLTMIPSNEGEFYISIGVKGSSIQKAVKISVIESKYTIKVNFDYVFTYYYITNIPDYLSMSKYDENFVKLLNSETGENLRSNYEPEFSSIVNRIGKQRIYIKFNIDNVEKYFAFDIKFTMNPKYNYDGYDALSDDQKVTYYRSFLEYVTYNRPSYYSIEETYNDLEYEYNNSLSAKNKSTLASDFDFIVLYRRYINSTNLDKSFFNEITVSFGIRKYLVPILIIIFVCLTLIITFILCFYFVYRKKGYEEND